MTDGPGFEGRGFAFPPSFGPGGASVAMVEGDADIAESLQIILATAAGERVMQPDFGANLEEFLFEEMDPSLIAQVSQTVSDAIQIHEPRIELTDVQVTPDPDTAGLLRVELSYVNLATNSRWNLVWPFYLREAIPDPGVVGA